MKRSDNAFNLSLVSIASLCALLPLSYWPLIQLGKLQGVNLDISLLYVLCAVVVALHAPLIWRHKNMLVRSKTWLLMAIFTSWQLLATTWSLNQTRGLFTAIFTLLLFSIATIMMIRMPQLQAQWSKRRPFLVVGFGLLFIWPFWQLIGASLSVPLQWLLLPSMYDSSVFGVARVTGFALEPQFFGSLLLIPLIWSLYRVVSSKHVTAATYLVYVTSTFLLLCTLSRGALIAAVVGSLVVVVALRPALRRIGILTGLTAATLVVVAGTWWTLGTLQVNDEFDGRETLSRITNHLSFGQFSLPAPAESTSPDVIEAPTPRNTGYVSESTDSRLSMSDAALSLWSQDQLKQFIGVGTGGIGASLAQTNAQFTIGSIVNNHYLELLAETGLVGLTLFAAAWISVLLGLVRRSQWLVLGLLLGFLSQWLFFSGSANVVHVWVILGVALALAKSAPTRVNLLQ